MVILKVNATFLRILLFNSCYWGRHSTRIVFRSPSEHLLVGETARFDKEKITPGRERFRGDSDKTPPSRDSRSQEGNDEKLQQQDCHITVYHSES